MSISSWHDRKISIINDTVNGNDLEMINGQIIYLSEYKMDVKEGFSFIYKQGQTVMRYFEHGVIRKELEFDIESSD